MNTQQPSPKKSLKDSLFERIESDHVCPRSNLSFLCQECLVWIVWLFSIAIGSLTIAVSIFVITQRQYALYEATHDNFLTFIVGALPYIWILAFGIMVYVAIRNFRCTKHGYKYSVHAVILSSVALSLMGGVALQHYGLGYSVDSSLGNRVGGYLSQEKLEKKAWQAPEEGRLLGKQVLDSVSPQKAFIFEDAEGKQWRMNVTELMKQELDLLATEKTVRLLGKAEYGGKEIFHVCGVFPWMVEKDMTLGELREQRKQFVDRVYDHLEKEKERNRLMEEQGISSNSRTEKGICADITAVRRMPVMKAHQ
ncbi:MAG: hypothetical protein LR008_01985 [Candidatus Pacebacteria bacterium]|nr:hypothetical protein [Candidatus Paceibacterota bacterium]